MTLRRLLFGIVVLSLSFVVITTEAHAKDEDTHQRSQFARSNKLDETKQVRLTSKQLRVRGRVVTLSKHELEKLIKLASKRCGCSSPTQDTEFSMSCVKGCVARYVGWQTVLACGVACSGNLAGCAVCVGVHEWVVLGCIQYCAWRNVFSAVDGPEASNRGRPSTKRHAKSLVRSPASASLS
jgi:hypothetical protein